MERMIKLLKLHKCYNQQEVDFVLDRYKDNDTLLLVKLNDLEQKYFNQDLVDIERERFA